MRAQLKDRDLGREPRQNHSRELEGEHELTSSPRLSQNSGARHHFLDAEEPRASERRGQDQVSERERQPFRADSGGDQPLHQQGRHLAANGELAVHGHQAAEHQERKAAGTGIEGH